MRTRSALSLGLLSAAMFAMLVSCGVQNQAGAPAASVSPDGGGAIESDAGGTGDAGHLMDANSSAIRGDAGAAAVADASQTDAGAGDAAVHPG